MQKQQLPRSRPTNNQLLYKTHFRWEHYSSSPSFDSRALPLDTEACPSVTAAFLKVLEILQNLEYSRRPKRNILQILANNTRRTKVLELSSGTHRIPEELKKHHLTDENGAQYSTNLDRNRYGNDNNYLFTVIKHDLETLGLCPCLVDVEIIDAKSQGDSQLVTAGMEACVCSAVASAPVMQHLQLQHHVAPPRRMERPRMDEPVLPPRQRGIATCHSEGEGSQLFDALIAAAAAHSQDQDAADERQQELDNLGLSTLRNQVNRINGVSALPQYQPPEAAAPPPKRAAPKRQLTGLFSVNSSDLMGLAGFSNLGQSGIIANELEMDRKGEVEQGPGKKARASPAAPKQEADLVSEEGDTDRLREGGDEAGEDQALAPAGRTKVVPRQSSAIVTAPRNLPAEYHQLRADINQLRATTGQISSVFADSSEIHDRLRAEVAELRGEVRLLKEQKVAMAATLDETSQRVSGLERHLAESRTQMSGLFTFLQHLQQHGGAAGGLDKLFTGLQSPPASNVDAPLPATAHINTAALHTVPEQQDVVQASSAPRASALHVLPPSLNQAGQAPAAGDTLAPIARLDHTSGQEARPEYPSIGRGLSSIQNLNSRPDGLESLDAEGNGSDAWKLDDKEALKALPKFEKFGSLSDLGSLFSVGQSMEFLKPSRRPPRANQSITSPSPLVTAHQNGKASPDLKADDAAHEGHKHGVAGKIMDGANGSGEMTQTPTRPMVA